MMFTNINMNALNDVPHVEAKLKNLNPHLFVTMEDPVIHEFIEKIPEFVYVAACTAFIYIAYGVALCLFGWSVTTIWPFIQEWIEIICMISSISMTAMFLKWIHDETEEADTYIVKLKAELAAKNAIIAELEMKLADSLDSNSDSLDSNSDSLDSNSDSLDSNSDSLDSNSDSLDSNSDSLDSDSDSLDSDSDSLDSDSDYDPDLDEY